jgi:5'-nucleotidase / UDP-sugar diphosphatase
MNRFVRSLVPLFVGLVVIFQAFGQVGAGGISFVPGLPNSQGDFERLFLVREAVGGDRVPKELSAPREDLRQYHVTVFHINDLHGHITDSSSKKGDTHRVAQMFKELSEARGKAGPWDVILFLSAGDEHTGAAFDELVGWKPEDFALDPYYEVLSRAGLDASVVGNHEIDRGYEMEAVAVRSSAAFPVLSANIADSRNLGGATVPPALIGVSKGLRIGIIGLTTPEETRERTADDPQAFIRPPLDALEYYMRRMDPYVDVFVLMDHLGYEGETRHRVTVGDRAVAERAAGLSAKPILVVGGHTHSALNQSGLDPANLVHGIPIVQAGSYGSWLGRLDMDLIPRSDGFAVKSVQARLLPIKPRDDRVSANEAGYAGLEHEGDYDQDFERGAVRPILAMLGKKMKESLGKVAGDPEFKTERVVAERYVGECGIADYMNDLITARSKSFPGGPVDLAVFNASALSGGVEPDSVASFADWFSVMPYADNIVVCSMTGAQILAMLESNARRLVRPEELTGDKKVNLADFVSRGFLHFSGGLRYTIRLGASAGEARVEGATIKGADIGGALDRGFRVAFSTYIGGGMEGWKGGSIGAGLPASLNGYNLAAIGKLDTGMVYRNEIIAAIREQGGIRAPDGRPSLLDGRLEVLP